MLVFKCSVNGALKAFLPFRAVKQSVNFSINVCFDFCAQMFSYGSIQPFAIL